MHFCAPQIHNFQVHSDRVEVSIRPDTEEVWNEVESKVQRVISGIRDGFIPPQEKLMAERRTPAPPWSGLDVDLEKNGLVRRSGEGRAVLGPLLAGLVERFDRHFLDMADFFSAKPLGTPALIPADLMARIDYFKAFPHTLTFAYHLPADVDTIQKFSSAPLTTDGCISHHPDSGVNSLLSPAVCFHLYHYLENQTLPGPLESYTMRGRCFRYESGALTSLARLWDFTMREIVFVGEKDAVIEARKKSIDWIVELGKKLGIVYQIKTASDPFFVGEFRQRTVFQAAFDLKYEWLADLDPTSGPTLAVGSFNVHQTHFGKAFSILTPSGDVAWTGCMAFGLERLAYALIRQYGAEPSAWPDALKPLSLRK